MILQVDVLENSETEDHIDREDNEATLNLVRQMHENQGSDEEWLEDDYNAPAEIFEPKRKKTLYRKIKREVVSPRRSSNYYAHANVKPEKQHVIIDEPRKDEYSVFGEYIANKLRKFKAPRTRGNIQQLITTILWQAEYGLYDDADAVKRVLLSSVQDIEPEQNIVMQSHGTMTAIQTEQYSNDKKQDDSAESDSVTLIN